MSDVDYALRRETESAKQLIAVLREHGVLDDEDVVASAIEGETSLHEAIAAILDEIDVEDALVRGLEDKIEDFEERRNRIKLRIERQRAAIEQAMIICERDKMVLPTATLFLRKSKPGLVIDNEADIPSDFWKVETKMKLDKSALKSTLENGMPVDGAHLDNGSVSLTIRTK